MVGPTFVCPDVTIDEICKQAEYISSVDDISLFDIRTDFRFFEIITDVLSQLQTSAFFVSFCVNV